MQVFITMRANKPYREMDPAEYLNVFDGDKLYRALDSAKLPAEEAGDQSWDGKRLPFKRFEY